MADLIVYGASDDLVEVVGLVKDELNPPYGKPAFVTVKADDTVWARLAIEYDDEGIWRITPGGAPWAVIPARGDGLPDDEHGCPGYSDKAVLDMGDIEARRVDVAIEGVL